MADPRTRTRTVDQLMISDAFQSASPSTHPDRQLIIRVDGFATYILYNNNMLLRIVKQIEMGAFIQQTTVFTLFSQQI